jgi:all-trans-retinol 13,14-reductase
MQSYDFIVVGSGITGLTASRILAQHGKRVLLLEEAPILGGSLTRFRLDGIPFDVGFHFTGGFTAQRTGMLDEMLTLLGVRDGIRPQFFPRDASHRMIFSSLGADYVLPCGIEAARAALKRDFPRQCVGIDRYFARFNKVVAATPTLTVAGLDANPEALDEDHIYLQTVLDDCFSEPVLKALLGAWCMCYGTCPDQVSFATHCRVSFALQESLARVEDGGDAFVAALVDALRGDRLDVRTRTTIRECADIVDRKVRRFVLTDGTEVSAQGCIFTIHPRHILALLPPKNISRAFRQRVEDFEPSNGFFTVYGSLDHPGDDDLAMFTSILPDPDLNRLLTSRTPEAEEGAMIVLRAHERGPVGPVDTVTALEVAFPETTARWADTQTRRRPPEYDAYKAERTRSLEARIRHYVPECRAMRTLASASLLTYRDYLHSPDGSAYGIRQKMGQFNVSGRLPLANLYAAGQSALLPGVIGGMTSSFLICRGLLGRDVFRQYLSGRTCCSSVSS